MITKLQDVQINAQSRVLLRCDLNLPKDEEGEFSDLFRLESSLPTISYLVDKVSTVFIVSHLGSPKGQYSDSLSLKRVAQLLSSKLNQEVNFVEDPFQDSLNLNELKGVFLLENLRFWPGEEANSQDFAQDLVGSTSANLFVQDAFGVCHRSHSSLTKLPKLLPSCSGLLLQKEIELLSSPKSDKLSLIVGGAKVESKLPVINNFLGKAKDVLTGGVVANTFLKSSGSNIGSSLFSEDNIEQAAGILKDASSLNTEIILPSDYITAGSINSTSSQGYDSSNLPAEQVILDLGPETINQYQFKLSNSEVVIWAGTLGFAEKPIFSNASRQILQKLLELKQSNPKLVIIIGGGDTVDFARSNLTSDELSLIDHLSTGGGASLLVLAGEKLPGIEALSISGNNQDRVYSLVANLKSNFNLSQMHSWLDELLESQLPNLRKVNLSIAVPALFIEEASNKLESSKLKTNVKVISQDVSEHTEGAHTGEIAASMLKDLADGVMIGHSERRMSQGDSLEIVASKIERAVEEGLKITFCVGGASKDNQAQADEVRLQLNSALDKLKNAQSSNLEIAYEPVFAIGSGEVPSKEFLQSQLSLIKDILNNKSINSPVLYGGSVNATNVKDFIDIGFSGVLVGSASLQVASLENIGINMTN